MNLFDIVGPVMVGPSSSHTAGAVRIGQVSRHLLGESVKEAKILLHGSFLATGKGHGTAVSGNQRYPVPLRMEIPVSVWLDAADHDVRGQFGLCRCGTVRRSAGDSRHDHHW